MSPSQNNAAVSTPRRRFLAASGLAGLGALAFGHDAFAVGTGTQSAGVFPRRSRKRDRDILNLALNLEYLEAEFYLRAIGQNDGLAGNIDGRGTPGDVTGGRAVTFAIPEIAAYAQEIAADEKAHVLFLRQALGPARVARPAIDLEGSFTAAARAAGLVGPTETFDPYANDLTFLLAAFIFEDVGVTAYKGAAPLLLDPRLIGPAAGLLAVEAYHAANIRTALYAQRATVLPGGVTVAEAVQRISDARDSLDGDTDLDQGIVGDGLGAFDASEIDVSNIVPTDANGLAFSRTPRQVLNIVYLAPGTPAQGGFFPNGVNGTIS